MRQFLLACLGGMPLAMAPYANETPRRPDRVLYRAEQKAWITQQDDRLTVLHEPLLLDAPETWVLENDNVPGQFNNVNLYCFA